MQTALFKNLFDLQKYTKITEVHTPNGGIVDPIGCGGQKLKRLLESAV